MFWIFATFVKQTDHGTSYPTTSTFVSTTALYDFSRSLLPPTSSCCSFSFYSFSSLFSLFLFLFLLSSCRSLLPYPPQGDDDQTSYTTTITLLLFASPPQLFLVFFRLRFFFLLLLLSALRKTSVHYRRRGSKCSLQLQSGAMHSRDASTRCSRSLIRTQGDGDKEFVSSSFFSSLAAFYALYLPNGFNFARLAFRRSLFVE